MINLDIYEEVVGVIDVYRCSHCHSKLADLRAQGSSNIPTEAGFRELDGENSKWVLFVCKAHERIGYELEKVSARQTIDHDCAEKTFPLLVSDNFSLANKDEFHSILKIDDYLNETIKLEDTD